MTNASHEEIHRGGCLCGAVRITVRRHLRNVVNCHCSQCVRSHGHYAAHTSAKDDAITVDGAENVTWYRSSARAERGFCKVCGSQLFWKPLGTDRTAITAGSLDQPTGLKSKIHIHVASKPDYYEITDDLPQYERDNEI